MDSDDEMEMEAEGAEVDAGVEMKVVPRQIGTLQGCSEEQVAVVRSPAPSAPARSAGSTGSPSKGGGSEDDFLGLKKTAEVDWMM